MFEDITVFGMTVSAWIYVPVIYFLWVVVLISIKKITWAAITGFAKKTEAKVDDIVLHSLDLPINILIFASGIFVIDQISPLKADGELTQMIMIGFKAATIIAIVLFLDKLFAALIETYSHKVSVLQTSKGVMRVILRVVVMSVGVLILLDSFGVSITPILASLGIGSLAVALALQPTLENFFAGVQIVIDRPIRLGQFVKLDSGEEGYVEKIGWRSTYVRQLPNNTVVVPNNKLVNSKILNYYYPQKEMAVLVQVGVSYEADLAHVEKVTIEVGEEVLKTVQGGVATFKPFIRYHTFNDFSIDFTVILRAQEFVDNYLIKHEFIKRLHKRYNEEGIVIPFPIRTLEANQEYLDALKG